LSVWEILSSGWPGNLFFFPKKTKKFRLLCWIFGFSKIDSEINEKQNQKTCCSYTTNLRPMQPRGFSVQPLSHIFQKRIEVFFKWGNDSWICHLSQCSRSWWCLLQRDENSGLLFLMDTDWLEHWCHTLSMHPNHRNLQQVTYHGIKRAHHNKLINHRHSCVLCWYVSNVCSEHQLHPS
jgi:hypothetical protein